jgi:hypothetical protein
MPALQVHPFLHLKVLSLPLNDTSRSKSSGRRFCISLKDVTVQQLLIFLCLELQCQKRLYHYRRAEPEKCHCKNGTKMGF